MRTGCGLRTVVKILEVFSEVLGKNFGKSPCYNTVENWIKKLGLSVYQDDQPCKGKKFAMVMDESIAINGQVYHHYSVPTILQVVTRICFRKKLFYYRF